MKPVSRLLAIILLVSSLLNLLASPADAVSLTPAFIQNDVNFSGSASTTISTSFTSPNAAGNFIIAYVVWNASNTPSTTVTDTAGNTYVAVGVPSTTVADSSAQLFYAKNIAAGSNTVMANFSTSSSFQFLYIHEYSNIDKTNPLDQTVNANGFGTAVDSGSLTTTFPTELLFSGSMSFDTESAGTGWTSRSTFFNGLTQDQIVSSAGTYNATATIDSSQSWMIQAATFRAAQIPPPAPLAAPVLQGGGTTTTNSRPTLTGTCTNENVVTIYVDSSAVAPAQVCSGGVYAITLSSPLANATYGITSSFADGGGTSSQSPTLSLTVHAPTPAPLAPNSGLPRASQNDLWIWVVVGSGALSIRGFFILKRQAKRRYGFHWRH